VRVFAHPLRMAAGAVATVEQGSVAQAQQLAVAIVSTAVNERALAPDFGIFDPVAVGTSPTEVVAAVDLCEPDLTVTDVRVGSDGTGRQRVDVSVQWNEEAN